MKKLLALILSSLVPFSMLVGGGSNVFTAALSVSAEDTTEESTAENKLADGRYAVPLTQMTSPLYSVNKAVTNNKCGFLSSIAFLNVDDGSIKVTVGVENWSYYDAFIPVKQNIDALILQL